jgi:hypothetical protein
VRHDWDLSNFPFDRHVLDIVLEEGAADTTKLLYSADTTNSGYNKDIRLEGWGLLTLVGLLGRYNIPNPRVDPAVRVYALPLYASKSL